MDIEVARTPPTKGTGIVERTAPIFVNIPSRIKIMPATSNVRRLATYKINFKNITNAYSKTCVTPITPIFSVCVVKPIPSPIKPDINEPAPIKIILFLFN